MGHINEENTAKSKARCTMTYFAREYNVILLGNIQFFTESDLPLKYSSSQETLVKLPETGTDPPMDSTEQLAL